jgi:hypothetical protein
MKGTAAIHDAVAPAIIAGDDSDTRACHKTRYVGFKKYDAKKKAVNDTGNTRH